MPRKRLSHNQGLPKRWRQVHGAYYYSVPPGLEHAWNGKKLFRLGEHLNEAYRTWADRLGAEDNAHTVSQLLERYTLEYVSTLKPQTQIGYKKAIRNLTAAIGHYGLAEVTPQEIYTYIRKRSAKIAARREKSVLSHAFTKAVEWGYIASHPFKGQVRLEGEKPRTRYITDAELEAIYALKPKRKGDPTKQIQAYIRIKCLTGARQGDILALTSSQINDEGIRIEQRKTGKKQLFQWTEELHKAVWEAQGERKIVAIGRPLFSTRRGKSYVNSITGEASGWQSIWQRFMKRLLDEKVIAERFTEHDIRAKTGSDSDSDEDARKRLGHDSVSTTRRAYRRKEEVVRPLR